MPYKYQPEVLIFFPPLALGKKAWALSQNTIPLNDIEEIMHTSHADKQNWYILSMVVYTTLVIFKSQIVEMQ